VQINFSQLSAPNALQSPHWPPPAFSLGRAVTWISVLNLSDENYMNRHMTESIGQLSLVKLWNGQRETGPPARQSGRRWIDSQ
jgi:hypothetical protein